MTQTEAKWAERVREWRASGRSAEQFAEGQGFKPSTLRFWASRLRVKTLSVTAPVARGEGGRVRLVRVDRTPSAIEGRAAARESSSSATVVIAIGTARIEVRPGFDRSLLSAVVETLGGAR
jgi:hypothetical protein